MLTLAPIVAWYDGAHGMSHTAWRCLGDRRIILWSPNPTIKTWAQLIHVNGSIAIAGPREEGLTLDHYVRLYTTEDFCKKAILAAVPWRDALSRLIDENSDGWTENLLIQLERRHAVDPLSLANELSPAAAEKVQRIRSELPKARTILLNARHITETPDGWFLDHNAVSYDRPPLRLTNFTMRVDTIVPSGTGFSHVGRMQINGKEIPFRLNRFELTHQLGRLLQTVSHQGQGGVVYVREGWALRLCEIAMAFQAPRYLKPGEEPAKGAKASQRTRPAAE